MNNLKTGVIGLGRMGQHHCRVYASQREAELVGFYDINPQVAREFSLKYDVPAFRRIDDLLEQVDAVSIATPTPTHFDLVMQCLEHGVHVLIEKPVTDSLDDAEHLARAVERSGLVVQVGHIERFNPTYLELKNVIECLKVVAVNFRRLSPYKGKRVGSFGTGTFSLYPTKNMTSAEGGMITTDDGKVDEECRVIRQHGMRRRYYHDELGFNFRMTDVHAAIGLEQLKKLDRNNQKRRENAQFLSENLKGVILPAVPKGYEHVYHQYTVRVPGGKRDALRTYLQEKEIGSEVYYPVPVHKQSFYMEMGYDQSLPEAERASAEVLSLPIHPALSKADLETIVAEVNHFMSQ